MPTVITFGTFDLFHVGHVRMLERAAKLGDRLVVGVSTDQLNYSKKQCYPVFPEADRVEIVSAIRWVDEVFLEHSLELKRQYVIQYHADILVMGDDWTGRFDFLKDICDVRYLLRTPGVSSSDIRSGLP